MDPTESCADSQKKKELDDMKKEDLQNLLKEAEDQLKQLDARKLAKEVLYIVRQFSRFVEV